MCNFTRQQQQHNNIQQLCFSDKILDKNIMEDTVCSFDKNDDKHNALFAIPKKGRLYELCVKLLAGAGLEYHRWKVFLER